MALVNTRLITLVDERLITQVHRRHYHLHRPQKLADTYKGTSLIRNSPTLGPYSRPVPRGLWWS